MSRENSPLFVGSATKKKTIVFDSDDSETDSIATDSTAESDVRDEYEVERILDEAPDGRYFVKWEGYKLSRCTWEPREHILGSDCLPEWERQKKRIAAGEAEKFNEDEYFKAYSQAHDEKMARRQRRNAKRQKRGLPIPTYSSEEGEENEEEVEEGELADESPDELR